MRWWPAAALGLAWTVGLAFVLSHRVFVTNDSLSNYAHVWNVSRAVADDHTLPFHFRALASGRALAYPYAFLPWTSAALVRPLLGDWVTTLWLVLGFGLALGATVLALPEIRTSWGLALVLANPLLVEAVLLGQLPFLWSVAFLFAAVWAWRRQRDVMATVLAIAAMSTHPAVVGPIFVVVVLSRLHWEPRGWRLLALSAVACTASLPAAGMAVFSPVTTDSSAGVLVANLVGTVAVRAMVVAVPFAVALSARRFSEGRLAMAAGVLVALNVVLVPVRQTAFAWGALTRDADTGLVPYLQSGEFHRGATYRLLRVADGKVGMYQLIQRGGILDSEFFPESLDRRSWPEEQEYVAFLADRKVQYVMIFDNYDQRYRTNEHELLGGLVARGCAASEHSEPGFEVFSVNTACVPEGPP